jgi:hypothetical protein
MYKIKYAKMGNPWEEKELATEEDLIAFVETLRSITERPSHVIIEATLGDELSLETYDHIVDKQLYAAQVFYVIGPEFGKYAGLYGGLPSTNKYLARTLGYKSGSRHANFLKKEITWVKKYSDSCPRCRLECNQSWAANKNNPLCDRCKEEVKNGGWMWEEEK